jgi:uncharacterized membrane protein
MNTIVDQLGGPIIAGLIGLFLAIVLGRVSFSGVKESASALNLVALENQKKANPGPDIILACSVIGFAIALSLAITGAYLVASYFANSIDIRIALIVLVLVCVTIAYFAATKLRRYELIQLQEAEKKKK